jgi:hypothetical protein
MACNSQHTLPMITVRVALSTVLFCSLASSVAAAGDDLTSSRPQSPRACACPDPFDTEVPAGIVWQGGPPAPDLPAIARLLGPMAVVLVR